MNVEKLNSLAYDLVEENKKLNYSGMLQSVISSLQNVISQPQQPNHQTTLSQQLEELHSALSESLVNNLSPAWYQVLVELDINHILGKNLSERINQILSKNQITPATAKSELEAVFNDLNTKMTGFQNLVSGLDSLEIGYDELENEECEIGILIPRDFFDNDLENLAEEIKELIFILNFFSELITGEKQSFQVRNLSTTDPLITVGTIIAIAGGFAKTVSWLIDSYKKLLEIKKLKQELKNNGLSAKNLKGITDYCNGHMEKSIEDIIKNLSKEYNGNGDQGRKNELLNAARISLNKLANRIDHGFNFEVRIGLIEDENEDETEPDPDVLEIQAASAALQFMKLEGAPILSLSEKSVKK
jgi:hypothetical protein